MSPQAVSESTKADLLSAYEAARGAFIVRFDGHEDFIVMRVSDLESEEPLSEAQLEQLEKDYAQAQHGETRDAFESLAEIRATCGL